MLESSIGPYRVIEKLGSGGMGDVYLAEDTRLHRRVAIKTLAETRSRTPDARERLLREARAAAALNHANIAAIYDVLESGDLLHIVMEYVEGQPLSARLTAGPLPRDEVTSIAHQLCDGMAAAHAQGVIHRDLKPGNVLLTPQGKVKVLDFGLAITLENPGEVLAVLASETTPSRPGQLQGTPAYMSPEQLRGQPIDHRTDIYSLGVLLFELATGRRPFHGATVAELGSAILTEPTPSAADVTAEITPGLSAIVARAMARDREQRFPSVVEMREALRRLPRSVSELTTVSDLLPWPAAIRAGGWTRALGIVLGLVLLGLVLVALIEPPWARPSSAFAARDWLLVADVENGTQESVFEDSLREGLVTSLDQSSYVNVVPRERVVEALRRMRREPTTRIDARVGREICQREAVKALLLSNIRRSGAAFQMRVQVIEAATGRPFFAESEQFTGPEQVFGRIDSLVRRVRERLGESLARIGGASRPLAQVTTLSLESLQLYSKAREARARGDVAAAQGLLRKSLEIDPDFALAHAFLGDLASGAGDVRGTSEHWTRAYELRDALTDRERSLVVADYQKLQGNYEKAAETLKLLVEVYPDDIHARRELAVAYDAAGEPSKGAEELRHVLRLDAYDAQARGNLGLFLVTAGHPEEARELYDDAGRRGLSSAYFGWGRGLAALSLGDVPGALEEFEKLGQAGPPFGSLGALYVARTFIFQGRFTLAHEQLASGLNAERKLGHGVFEALGRLLAARLFWLEGRRDAARRELGVLLAPGRQLEDESLRDAGQLLAQMRELGPARALLKRLESAPEGTNAFRKSCIRNLQAEIALAEGQAARAAELYRIAAEAYPQYVSHLGLARAYESLEDWPRAAEERRRVLNARGEILRVGFPADWVLGHLDLARVVRRQGDEAAAEKRFGEFLMLWDAEDLPLRQQALREWRRATGNKTFEKRKEGV